jgi:hypothetical protein
MMKPHTKVFSESEKGMVLVIIILVVSVLLLIGTSATMSTNTDLRISANYKSSVDALYVAEAGIQRALAYLRTGADINTSLTGGTPAGTLFGGSQNLSSGTYTVVLTNNTDDAGGASNDTDNKVVVTSTGTAEGGGKKIIEVVYYKPNPPGVRGAVTANYTVGTLGTMEVDGRNHDINGNLIGGSDSLLGVSAGSTVTEGGASTIGGETPSGILVAPTKTGGFGPPATGWASACEQNATWTKYTSPDSALGLPEGTLKSIALSGVGGSRYVTDPSALSAPLSGVTYVELPTGTTWHPPDFGVSSGILVVHNSTLNAQIENTNGGTFKGIMISDDCTHIHNSFIGAVINLSPALGNCIGNGDGSVKYSKAAVINALSAVWIQRSWREVY